MVFQTQLAESFESTVVHITSSAARERIFGSSSSCKVLEFFSDAIEKRPGRFVLVSLLTGEHPRDVFRLALRPDYCVQILMELL